MLFTASIKGDDRTGPWTRHPAAADRYLDCTFLLLAGYWPLPGATTRDYIQIFHLHVCTVSSPPPCPHLFIYFDFSPSNYINELFPLLN
ncbi:hypothetical protein V496_03864 [Pseudogymnoascus sp. VKM F-4515 (FW-2607)]|nr:hypothetical protein V496_03864 [Pseudogymnoascus sp. VKM F-4515 (FW-2607)]